MKLKSTIRKSLNLIGIEARFKPSFNQSDIVFLHIGKNAGTQFKLIAKQVNRLQNSKSFRVLPHHVRLTDLPNECDYLFSIRDPISRFKSAFYSRKRQGLPTYHNPWTGAEEEAFKFFENANCLAEALSPDHQMQAQAIFAMNSIGHIRDRQIDWFKGANNIFITRPPLFIIRQEKFEEDVRDFLLSQKILDLSLELNISQNPTMSHSNNYDGVPPLSKLAQKNLKEWYHQDYLFLKHCEKWVHLKKK